ncbi:MAG: hypothetical protein ACRDNS_11360 [Trebonia sp.]
MSEKAASRGLGADFGTGPLSRAAALVYTLLVTEGLFLVTALPGLVPLLLLDRDASNLPLDALCLLPAGPAASAALFALHRRQSDAADLHPAATFWRGYRLNAAAALRVFVPWLVIATMVAMTLAHRRADGVPGWWLVLLVVIAIAATLWLVNALVITSLFAFRTVDIARLAAYFLGRTPLVTLGNVGILLGAALITAYGTEALAALLVSVLGLLLLNSSRAMTERVRKEFTA